MIGKLRTFWIDVNPEPWVVPPFYPARTGKSMTVRAGRDQGLHAYQEAVREQLIEQGAEMLDGPYALRFYFYISLERYVTGKGRKVKENLPDTTNLQKAIEDAMQGVVLGNDREVVHTASSRRVIDKEGYTLVEVYYEVEDYPAPKGNLLKSLMQMIARRTGMTTRSNSDNEW